MCSPLPNERVRVTAKRILSASPVLRGEHHIALISIENIEPHQPDPFRCGQVGVILQLDISCDDRELAAFEPAMKAVADRKSARSKGAYFCDRDLVFGKDHRQVANRLVGDPY